MIKNSFDIIIIGGGVSGMILAEKILSKTNKRILIIEKNKEILKDKNLCFWSFPNNIINSEANNRWKKISVTIEGKKKIFFDERIEYLRIDSRTFKNFFLKRLKKNKKFSLEMGCRVFKIINNKTENIIVDTNKGAFKTSYIFDSRYDLKNQRNVKLFQHFLGIEIETKKEVFNKNEVVLMDIQKRKGEFHFIYLLPFKKNNALIESTYFSADIHNKTRYINDIKEYLSKNYKLTKFKIKYQETGIIPMGKIKNFNHEKLMKIGTAGNWVKSSTGYSLQNSFKYSEHIVDCLVEGKRPSLKRNYIFDFLDSIFCEFILRYPDEINNFFKNFFFKNNLFNIVKFLNNNSNLWETLKIILRLPKLKLIKTLLKVR